MIFMEFRARVMNDTLKPSMTRNAFETRVLFAGLTAREDYTITIKLMAKLVSISFGRRQEDDQVEKEK